MKALRTVLTINKNGRLVYRDYSRSWTKHFMEALYLSHANITSATPLATIKDIMGSEVRAADTEGSHPAVASELKSNLLAAAPAGHAGILLQNGGSGNNDLAYGRAHWVSGNSFGIMIGRDATAATPSDYRLIDPIGHGIGATVAVAASLESFTAEDGDVNSQTTNSAVGAIYVPKRTILVTRIDMKCWRTGNPGNVTMRVGGVKNSAVNQVSSESTTIGESDVVNANLWGNATPGAVVTFTFSTPVLMLAGLPYFCYIYPSQSGAGQYVNIRYKNLGVAQNGPIKTFVNAAAHPGALSITDYHHVYFDIWGTIGAEMEWGGTDFYGFTIADPNASFSLSRLFRNNSGESIEVNECGLVVPVMRYFTVTENYAFNSFMVLAARDVIAPHIDVADGENIEVIYTPSITV